MSLFERLHAVRQQERAQSAEKAPESDQGLGPAVMKLNFRLRMLTVWRKEGDGRR